MKKHFLRSTGAKRAKKSPKAHTKTDTSSQEKLFEEIQNSFLVCVIIGFHIVVSDALPLGIFLPVFLFASA